MKDKDSVIEVRDFRKTYGDLVAVEGIRFDVKQGEILGLLGQMGRERPVRWNAWKACGHQPAARCG